MCYRVVFSVLNQSYGQRRFSNYLSLWCCPLPLPHAPSAPPPPPHIRLYGTGEILQNVINIFYIFVLPVANIYHAVMPSLTKMFSVDK
jgi:hypothetical protein